MLGSGCEGLTNVLSWPEGKPAPIPGLSKSNAEKLAGKSVKSDLSPPSLKKEIRFIFSCLQSFVDRRYSEPGLEDSDLLQKLDWNFIVACARAQRVLPFLGLALNKATALGKLSGNIQREIERSLHHAEWENTVKRMQFEKIRQIFARENIPIIPLKGIALTHLVYRENPIRMMGDVDIFIKQKDLPNVCRLLEEKDFKLEGLVSDWQDAMSRRFIGRWGYVKEGLNADIQWQPRFLIRGHLVEWDYRQAWERASPCRELGSNVFMLSPLDLSRYLLLQIANDFECNIPFLIQFLDLALVMKNENLAREDILGEGIPDLHSAARDRLQGLLGVVQECFLETECFSKFSKDTQEVLESLLNGNRNISDLFGLRSFFQMTHSFRERFIFMAGYFFPSRRYLEDTYGRSWLALLSGYFKHLGRLLVKTGSLMKTVWRRDDDFR